MLVLVPLGKVAVVGACGGEAVPAWGFVYAEGDTSTKFSACSHRGLSDGTLDYVAEEGAG